LQYAQNFPSCGVNVVSSKYLLSNYPSLKTQTIFCLDPLMMHQDDREIGYLESKTDHVRFLLFVFQLKDIGYCAYPNPISIGG
jgi:hypothetical protein